MIFIPMELAGIVRHVTEHQVRALEAIGWKRMPGADQGSDAGKKDALTQKSPRATRRKTK